MSIGNRDSIKSFRILYKDPAGLGGEVLWDGENAEVVTPRSGALE